MTKKRKMFICILAGILGLTVTACAGSEGSGGVNDAHSYTFWMTQGEDSSYYSDYKDNPGVQYSLLNTYKGENGKETKIDIDIEIPATGTEENNLNTLISTGDYMDVMDMSLYKGSIEDLYNQGIVQDLTSYVEEYMPNYKAFLDANPNLKLTATNLIDGERKYLQLYTYDAQLQDQWGGICYRRDWIVKYGKNPSDGSSFSGEYTVKNDDGTYDVDSWKDNVVFPSGGSDPIYISDWEWMLAIFKTAIEDQGIADGYCMSLYYPGFDGMGDLTCAFGGGTTGSAYISKEGKLIYSGNDDDFRLYLQVMNKWYKNGWIDTAFPEHASDMFYEVDDTKVRQGKVGLWIGVASQLIGKIATEDGYSKGMVVYGARQPMNDIYGTEEQKNVEPYSFYQKGQEGVPFIITDKAGEKDMVALCSYLDYFFSEEGMLLKTYGLNKEQYEATQNELYTRYGLTEGAYTDTVNADGIHEIMWVDRLQKDEALQGVVTCNRMFGLKGLPEGYIELKPYEREAFRHSLHEWVAYTNTGCITGSFLGQLVGEDAETYSKISIMLGEFTNKAIPSFIKGEKDPNSDEDWEAYKKALSKYSPDKITQVLQDLYDRLQE